MNNLPDNNTSSILVEEDSFDLKSVLSKIVDKWYWLAIGFIVALCIAFFYIYFTPPSYQIKSRVLVNDDEKGGNLGKQAGSMMDLGSVLGSKSSVDNEVEVLKTRFLMEQVVRQMQLNITYERRSGLVKRMLEDTPFKLIILNSIDTIEKTRINIETISPTKFRVSAGSLEKVVQFNENFNLKDVGVVRLIPNPEVKINNKNYSIIVTSIDERVTDLMKELKVAVSNKQVTIIDLDLSYPLQAQGEIMLSTLINKYTEVNLEDKNAIADSTYKFIKGRINIIAAELGDVENEVENFKQNNKLSDMSEQSKLLVQNTGEFTSDLAKAETQVSVLSDLEKYLKDENKNKRVFPTSLLPSDLVFSDLLGQYNLLLVERDKQLLSVTENSPFIQNIDTQISGLRRGILANIESTKNTYIITRDKLRSQLSKVENQIVGVPQIEKNYLKLARNQKIKEELYIFLMQKAEETAISKTSNIAVAKVIDPPKADIIPLSPKKSTVFIVCVALGLIIPVIILLLKEYFNTTVSTKDDVTKVTSVPVIGEISHNVTNDNLIVSSQGRSAISEQFRALRTNLSFYLKKPDQKVILLTSCNSGEGKSFTAINLANILAISGKKVLLMELDLRKPGLSGKLNIKQSLGFTNYTIDPSIRLDDIIQPLSIHSNMFIIPSGPLPPNPAETLMSESTAVLIDKLKERFDYILMDAPPIGIITDAQLLSSYASITLFLVRQNVTQKANLQIVQDLFIGNKMNNLGIVVNDIKGKYFSYGADYGNYGEEKKTTFFSSVFNRG
jgi:tyrosine-protein kinase Etk/Wzc